jgi:hypothetical protein
MQQNLDTLKDEIAVALDQGGFAVFHGGGRTVDPGNCVRWDVDQYPDPHTFLDTARKADAKMVVFHHRRFSAVDVDDALEDLETADLSREERRDFERRLRPLREYDGFTCLVELSFTIGGIWYVFQTATPWYDDFLSVITDIRDTLDAMEDDDGGPSPGPLGGYFSHN